VFAVPGPITSPTSAGTNRLIRDGAAPCLEPADLIAAYPALASRAAARRAGRGAAAPGAAGEPPDPVLALLTREPLPLDVLAARLGRPAAGVLAALTTLELAGRVARRPDGRFEAAGRA
jgi:DNA processing protein